MSQVMVEASRSDSQMIFPYIDRLMVLMKVALSDKMDVQTPPLTCHPIGDDGIYRLYQIYTAPFSNSRSILSHPVTIEARKATSLFFSRIHSTHRYWNWELRIEELTGRNGYP